MAWRFPVDAAFDMVVDGGAELLDCRFVEADTDYVTVDRDWIIMGFRRFSRIRSQVRVDAIRAIHEHALRPAPESLVPPEDRVGV